MNEDSTAPEPAAETGDEIGDERDDELDVPDLDADLDADVETDLDTDLETDLDTSMDSVEDVDSTTATVDLPVGDVAVFKRAIEAIVLVAQDPVPPDLIAQLLEQPVVAVTRWCEELRAEYVAQGRGFELARVAGGYRYQTHPDETPYVERFVLNDQRARLSGAALETLAIIAYKQPISRAQVASIRGVDPDGVIRTLAARGYIDEVGRDDGPGQAVLFGTTQLFLEKLGLDSLDNLPPIAEFIPDADVVEALEHGLRARPQEPSDLPSTPSDDQAGVVRLVAAAETAETLEVEIGQVEIGQVEIVEIETPEVETLEVETPEVESVNEIVIEDGPSVEQREP